MSSLKKAILIAIVYLLNSNCNSIGGMTANNMLYQTNPFAGLVSSGYREVASLRGKNREFLGDVYVKENPRYKNQVLTALLVIKSHGLELDTLYQINAHGDFINGDKKKEEKKAAKAYYGFQLDKQKKGHKDVFSIGLVDSKGSRYPDNNYYLFDWNYKTKKFEYYPAP